MGEKHYISTVLVVFLNKGLCDLKPPTINTVYDGDIIT